MQHKYTIEWSDRAAPSYSSWKASDQRYDTADAAARAAADWLLVNHGHGVNIQVRITRVEQPPAVEAVDDDFAKAA
jgi:hypothetical protein